MPINTFHAVLGLRVYADRMSNKAVLFLSIFTFLIPVVVAAQPTAIQVLNSQPLYFEENRGQMDSQVKFVARGTGNAVLISDNEATLMLGRKENVETVSLKLDGSVPGSVLRGVDQLPGRVNYFIGNDPSRWLTDLRTYSRVERRGVYPGIDLVYYGNEQQLEYDLIVSPGADPNAIRMRFDGAQRVRLNAAGDLVVETAAGELRQLRPRIYQVSAGMRTPVAGTYTLIGENQVAFNLPAYDHSKALVIDPTLVYASYLGGGAAAMAVDPAGSVYITGTPASTQFPVVSAYQSSPGAVFITKITPGTGIVYSTYIGGLNVSGSAGIAVDSSGNAYVTGWTYSQYDFPILNADQPQFPPFWTGVGAGFALKLAATGNALVFSTYLSGDNPRGIAADPSGNSYVLGPTRSDTIPLLNAFQPKFTSTGSTGTPWVVKFGPTGTKLFATYLGGSGFDGANAIAADATGVYVAGTTSSPDFPIANAAQPSLNNKAQAAFVTKFNPAGSALIFSTYLGAASNTTSVNGMALDAAGNVYLEGTGVPSPAAPTLTFGTDSSFIAKLLADGSALAYWVKFGSPNPTGTLETPISAIAVDGQGHAHVAGTAWSNSFLTASPFQATLNGTTDAFVAKLNASGTGIVYSSFLGGNGADTGSAIGVDSQGAAYVAGGILLASNPTFPTVAPIQADPGSSSYAGFLAKIADSTPFIDSMSPASAVAGGAAFTLTLTGSNFTPSTVASWNGNARTTTYVSPTQITAAITAADIAAIGSATVSLVETAPDSSLFLTFQIGSGLNPLPFASSIMPPSGIVGGSAFSMTVMGGGFIPSSVVRWNGQDRTTTYISSGQLTAKILASDLAATGPVPVTVFNPTPGGGTSQTLNFTVNINHAITSLSPGSGFAGGTGFTLTVNGVNFVNGAVVQWNGSNRATTFVSSTQLTAQITAGDISYPSNAQVTVFIPGPAGGTSAQFAFTVTGNYPTPVLVSVAPTSIVSCTSGALDITGSGFVVPTTSPYAPGTSVSASGLSVSTITVVDTTHIKILFSGATSTPIMITATNPSPGGGISNALVLNVNNPAPTISYINPSSATAGGSAFSFQVGAGCGMPTNAVIRWNETALTTITNYSYATATVPAADIANAGTASVTLFYPTPGGGESAPLTFTINPLPAPVPVISSIMPTTAAVGSSSLTLSVNGSSFTSLSLVRWNGANRATTFVSATLLKATITAADLVSAGTAQVTVYTPYPGGGTSNLKAFTISSQLTAGGTLQAGFNTGPSGTAVRVPIVLGLNSGVTVDSLAFGVSVLATGGAPALTGSLAFETNAAMPAPSQLDLSSAPNSMSAFWTGLTPLNGTVALGNLVVNLPPTASNGQMYQVQILAASGSLASINVSLNVGAGSITVGTGAVGGVDYGVGDVYPLTGDSLGSFGDSQLNTLDLIAVLRAVTAIPGYRPSACTDRFDAMDAFPADTTTTRGGDGQLDTLDLIVMLKRVVNIDTSRPRRVSRYLACPAGSVDPPQAMRRLPNGSAILRLELGASANSTAGIPIYLVAVESVQLSGFSFSAGGSGVGFTAANKPSLSDNGVQDTVAVGWLDGFSMRAGDRMLLGYLTGNSAPSLLGVSANAVSGDNIAVELGSTRAIKR
jgi:hypothetical protein